MYTKEMAQVNVCWVQKVQGKCDIKTGRRKGSISHSESLCC